ncbi:MAG: hypothetical protein ABIF12_03355, partial [bacterium]
LPNAIKGDGFFNKIRLEEQINKRNKKNKIKYIRATFQNFKKTDFSHKSLNMILFYDSNFYKTDFSNSYIFSCDFESTTLTKANFTKATLCIENLEKTKSVKDANFYRSTGLTNKQKKFLRENGAINVPEDLSPEDECIDACSSIAGLIAFVGIGSVVLHLISDL